MALQVVSGNVACVRVPGPADSGRRAICCRGSAGVGACSGLGGARSAIGAARPQQLPLGAARRRGHRAATIARAHGWDRPAPLREPSYVVMWPTGFTEVASAITALRDGRTVVINLASMPNNIDEQQRSVDFVAGGCHALGGRQERLSEGIFLFTPPDVIVATADATSSYSPYTTALSQRSALISLAKTSLSAEEEGAGCPADS
eukprot:CAMPEP_0182859414 /NCGR_PEP_ID=MMETSP0034_2-20130328/4282_1 /TAXON_ID=156128 /ORGANISM="Nephroselmis pyriformis, Strain CCMP717" /LENGTH=203 /DNA_ID=CAMNT_0024991015 /DNA_START=18 /DNA_END=629 /DNA_ORIENTATION=-